MDETLYDREKPSVFERDRLRQQADVAQTALSANLQGQLSTIAHVLSAMLLTALLALVLAAIAVWLILDALRLQAPFRLLTTTRAALGTQTYVTAQCFSSGKSDLIDDLAAWPCSAGSAGSWMWRLVSDHGYDEALDTCQLLLSIQKRHGSGPVLLILQGGHDMTPMTTSTVQEFESNQNLAFLRAAHLEGHLRQANCDQATDSNPLFVLTARGSAARHSPEHRRVWLHVVGLEKQTTAAEVLR